MKNLKKVLALVVVFAMMMSTAAFAAFPDVAEDADYANAVNTLAQLGFFTGDDQGNFNPDATITRAEYATIVCRLLGLDASGVADFADVPATHWGTGYINAASQAGVIKGYGDGNFGPDAPVKYEEAVAMLIRALGYEPLAISKGGWTQGYISVASSYGLLTGVDGTLGEGAKRSAVAVMTYNALDIPMVEQTGFGTDVQYTIMKNTDDQDKVTLLTKLDIYKLGGIVISNAKVAYSNGTTQDKGFIQIHVTDDYDNPIKALRFTDNENGRLDIDDNAQLIRDTEDLAADYIATNVVAYVEEYSSNNFDLVAIESADAIGDGLVIDLADVNGSTTDFEADKPVIKYYKDGASKTTSAYLEVAGDGDDYGYDIVLNDVLLADEDLTAVKNMIIAEGLVGTAELIDWDNDNRYDIVDITSYVHVIVEEVDAKNGIITTYNDDMGRIDLDIENDEALVTVKDINGNDVDFTTLVEYDVLAMVVSPSPILGGVGVGDADDYNSIDIITLGQSKIEGVIRGEGTTAAGDALYTIGSDKYEYEASMLGDTDINYLENELEVTAEGTFFLGINGKIVGYEGSSAADGEYAFIIGTYGTRASNATMTLLTKDGINTYNYADKVKLSNAATNEGVRYDVKANANTIDDALLAGTAWEGIEENDEAIYSYLAAAYDEEITDIAETAADEADERLIQVNFNADGAISEIIPMVVEEAKPFDKEDAVYKEATQKLFSKTLADALIVFDIDVDDLTRSTVKDLAFLVNDSNYGGILYNTNDDNQYESLVLLESDSKFELGAPLAIVTSVEEGINEETDAEIITATVVVDGAEATIVIDEEDTDDANLSDFAFGTVLLYNADSTGLVSNYVVVGNADLNYVGGEMTMGFAFDATFAANAFDDYNVDAATPEEEDAYFAGYFVERTNKTVDLYVLDSISAYAYASTEENPEGVIGTVQSFPGYSAANSYLFTSTGKTKEVEIGSALTGLTKHDDDTDEIWNLVVVRTVDGALQEVIAFDYDFEEEPVLETVYGSLGLAE